jgi:hypothetical protein
VAICAALAGPGCGGDGDEEGPPESLGIEGLYKLKTYESNKGCDGSSWVDLIKAGGTCLKWVRATLAEFEGHHYYGYKACCSESLCGSTGTGIRVLKWEGGAWKPHVSIQEGQVIDAQGKSTCGYKYGALEDYKRDGTALTYKFREYDYNSSDPWGQCDTTKAGADLSKYKCTRLLRVTAEWSSD